MDVFMHSEEMQPMTDHADRDANAERKPLLLSPKGVSRKSK